MEGVEGAFPGLRVQPYGQHVLAGRDVPGRANAEVVGHAGVVTGGQVLGFGRQSVAPAHGHTLRVRRRHAKR